MTEEEETGRPNHPRRAAWAIDWLCTAFGFERKIVVPGEAGRIAHVELVLGNGMIMLGDAETEYRRLVWPPVPPENVNTQELYVVVEDVDAYYAREKVAGAEIVIDIKTQDYCGRDYTTRDVEGNVWTFGSYDPWV